MIATLLLCLCGNRKLARERICRGCRESRMLITSGVLRPRADVRKSILVTSAVNVERRRVDARMSKPMRTTPTASEEKVLAWHGANDDTMPMFEEASAS